ncbi:MAG: hypothetical protein HN576_08090 [Bacteriovoracaceae bacterium]|nr:hypothetical protein [Bacteriovoracaceae bacterium]
MPPSLLNFDYSATLEGKSQNKEHRIVLEIRLSEFLKSIAHALFIGPKLIKHSAPGKFEVVTGRANPFSLIIKKR